jgi:hypothetical protein
VLFVTYGGGHVRMVVPVASHLQTLGDQITVLGLTGAADVVRDAGLPLRQFKDYVLPTDREALAIGERLAADLSYDHDPSESRAYLGLSYRELQTTWGAEEAARRFHAQGRQAFLPLGVLRRVLDVERPDLVVVTNSPRAEQAAALVAAERSTPCVCLVDLFAMDEYRWIARPGYANKVCVLNERVRDFLVAKGRPHGDIAVTGNPAFDTLFDPAHRQAAESLRKRRQWGNLRLLLWPVQTEPPRHPFTGAPGDALLPHKALKATADWVRRTGACLLLVRPREPGQHIEIEEGTHWQLAGQDVPLAPLLHAVQAVATLNSTVGLQAHLLGRPVVQVLGSVFDETTPLFEFGIAQAAVPLARLDSALDSLAWTEATLPDERQPLATQRVAQVIQTMR